MTKPITWFGSVILLLSGAVANAQSLYTRSGVAQIDGGQNVTLNFDSSLGIVSPVSAQLSIANNQNNSVVPSITVTTNTYANFGSITEQNCVNGQYCEVVAGSIVMSNQNESTTIQLPTALTLKSILDEANANLGNIALAQTRIDNDAYSNVVDANLPSQSAFANFTARVDVSSKAVGAHTQQLKVKDGNNVWSDALTLGFGVYPEPVLNSDASLTGIKSYQTRVNGSFNPVVLLNASITTEIEYTVNTAQLASGAHALTLFVKDSDNEVAQIDSVLPVFAAGSANFATIDYIETYANTNPGLGNGINLSELNSFDYVGGVSSLNLYKQLHGMHVRAVDTDGDITTMKTMYAGMDSDNDGVINDLDPLPNDGTETLDTDGDGIGNNQDTDDDGDGVLDVNDAFALDPNESVDTDGDGIGNNADLDDDGDGLSDVYESENGLDPLTSNVGVDSDNDGVSDYDEFMMNTNPRNADSDGDGLSDGDELAAGLDPLTHDDVNIEKQQLAANQTVFRVKQGQPFVVSWKYSTSDAHTALSGLTLRVHFDSNVLRWDNVNTPLQTSFVSVSSVQVDSDNTDLDVKTNRFVEFKWLDGDKNWPGANDVALLATQFSLVGTLADFESTSVRLSSIDQAERIESGPAYTLYA